MSQQQQQTSSRLLPLIGGLGVFMVVVGVVIGAVQTLRAPDAAGAAAAPALVLIEPAGSDTVPTPVELRFTAGNRLQLGPMGWASDDLHLHAYVDDREVMPAADDIQAAPDGTFRWRIPVDPGFHRIQLRWAGMNHGAIDAGASRTVQVVVR